MKKTKFRSLGIIAAICLVLMLAIGASADVAPTAITVTPSTLSMTVGGADQALTYTFTPAETDLRNVNWFSTAENVATVSQGGTVHAVGPGTATIQCVSAASASVVGTCTVTVTAPVTGVTLNSASLTLEKGKTATLVASIQPANASNQAVQWNSSDTAVATVANGVVSAVGVGNTTITVTTSDGGKQATCAVTVTEMKAVSITFNPTSISVKTGVPTQLTPIVQPAGATTNFSYWSTNPSVVEVNSSTGVITAKAAGSAQIYAQDSVSGKQASITVNATLTEVPVTGITGSTAPINVTLGSKINVKQYFTFTPANYNTAVTFRVTGGTATGNLTASGDFTPLTVGPVQISALSGMYSATISLNVVAQGGITPGTEAVPVTNVSVSPTTYQLYGGSSVQLTAVVEPENATYKAVTWSSSDPKVATVDANGYVTGIANGTTTVTATSISGSKTASCVVTVYGAQYDAGAVLVNAIMLDKSILALKAGGYATLTVTLSPVDATNTNVEWSSSNPAVATVMGNGTNAFVMAGTQSGMAVLTAKATDGSGTAATCSVTVTGGTTANQGTMNQGTPNQGTTTVTPTEKVSSITLNNKTLELEVGKTATLSATVSPVGATGTKLDWTSSDTSVLTVSNGTVTALKAGSANVVVMADDSSGKYAVCSVTVKAPATTTPEPSNPSTPTTPTTPDPQTKPVEIKVTGISFAETKLEMTVGDDPEQLHAIITPANATNQKVIWRSTNEAVVKVVNGILTPVAAGTAQVMAMSEDSADYATCTVTVKKKTTSSSTPSNSETSTTVKVSDVALNRYELTLTEGETATLTSTVSPSNASNKKVSWSSSDKSVATVSSGKITAVAPGTVNITVKSSADSDISATCVVTVVAKQEVVTLTGLAFDKQNLMLKVGELSLLSPVYTPANVTNRDLIWSSGDLNVVEVVNGIVTAKAPGATTVTAISATTGIMATCTVIVEENTPVVTDPVIPSDPTTPVEPSDPTTPTDPSVPTDNPTDTVEDGGVAWGTIILIACIVVAVIAVAVIVLLLLKR